MRYHVCYIAKMGKAHKKNSYLASVWEKEIVRTPNIKFSSLKNQVKL